MDLKETPVPTPPAVPKAGLLIGAVILVAVVTGAIAVLRIDPWSEQGVGRPASPSGNRQQRPTIDPALIRYEQTGEIPVSMQQVRAMAVGPGDRIYVGGDRVIRVLDPDGTRCSEIALEDQPRCLAVGGVEHAFPGRVYVGMKDHVEVYDGEGNRQAVWDGLGEKALLTSIAAAEEDLFVADARGTIVLRYDTSGRLLGRIGARDEQRRIPGFRIIKPYFDLAVGSDGLLRVVNPGALRIEVYTFQGHLELFWPQQRLPGIEGFFGCCNPAQLAILADGRLVTAEKGIARVKVYSAQGQFECVVAGPDQLDLTSDQVIADVAADGRNRILILDPKAGSVRIFEHKQANSGAEQ